MMMMMMIIIIIIDISENKRMEQESKIYDLCPEVLGV